MLDRLIFSGRGLIKQGGGKETVTSPRPTRPLEREAEWWGWWRIPHILSRGGTPNGIRTRATALKGRRPWPLDDGSHEQFILARHAQVCRAEA